MFTTLPLAAISPACLGPAGCGSELWGPLALGACIAVIAVGVAVARRPAAGVPAATPDRLAQLIGIAMVVVAGPVAVVALLGLLARLGWWPWGTIVPLSTASTCVIDDGTATCTYAAAPVTRWALAALGAASVVIAVGIVAAALRRAVGVAVPQFVLLVLGVGIALAGLSGLPTPRGADNPAGSIWCDWGYAPTRYVPAENRDPGQCTSFLSDDEANSGKDRNDTSWIGYGLGPSPTPLAVGENWDSPVVPPSPDRRGLVLMVAGLGSMGLAAGIGRWRRRAETDEVSPQ